MIQLVLGKNKSSARILCLGAHCDDIEIGCGGTLLRLIEDYRGNLVVRWVVFSANSERRREALRSAQAILKRLKQKTISIQSFADSFFPYRNASEIKECLHQVSREFSPDLIFTHHGKDLHQDHRLVSELTWNAFRDHCILEYEIPKYDGDLGQPNVFIPLDKSVCRNKANHLIRYFKSQRHRNWFTKDTFMALQRLRGIECNSTSGYAEAFYCRKIVL
jgi:LmbE family N-acetylglucosaminyl deacetylase